MSAEAAPPCGSFLSSVRRWQWQVLSRPRPCDNWQRGNVDPACRIIDINDDAGDETDNDDTGNDHADKDTDDDGDDTEQEVEY